jgi:hypothetical protein
MLYYLKKLKNFTCQKSQTCAFIYRYIHVLRMYLVWNFLKPHVIQSLDESLDEEKLELKEYLLKHHYPQIFPYEYTKKYKAKDVLVYTDKTCGLHYVLHENKKLYFRRGLWPFDVQAYHRDLLVEQDLNSPHRYEYGDFCVEDGDVVVDAGAAEAMFALSVIERVSKVYIFESDPIWLEALQLTFAPWKEKVEIINKFVSDHDDKDCVKLDTVLQNTRVNFIKADVEGAEAQLLSGAANLLAGQPDLKVAICTYHNPDDAEKLSRSLSGYSFQITFSRGYMLFFDGRKPFVRRGLIRAVKN